jgi:PhoPQ-activated pathogenicity-related protein
MLTLLLALTASSSPPQELYNYLAKKDASYAFRVAKEDDGGTTIELTSQTWQGRPWRHTILLRQPKKLAARGTGILYITGDGPRDGDYRQLAFFSEATGMPVAMLFDVPNQPLWDMREDDLIAHTFQKYIETRDPDWPLLFPMTKSALRAMDAVQGVTKNADNPLTNFVVTGASKRGWTTWFVGASHDPRVLGIAPMVYDNLNVTKQMPHQIKQWGKYSEMIEDYTRRGLQQQLNKEPGKTLARIIDPYTYRSEIKVPTLIVTGGNDRYWTVDAMSQYWNDLKQPKWAKVIPNVGHDLGGGLEAANTIGAFARSLAGVAPMPKPTWRFTDERSATRIRVGSDVPFEDARVWIAWSDTTDFRDAKWQATAKLTPAEPEMAFLVPQKNAVAFVEFRYRIGDRTFSVTTPTRVLKK